jgi:cysteine dioxygenase
MSRRDCYTRTCAYRDDGFEVLLLNWAVGAASAIHDHGDQDCWMLVLSGSLRVDDFVRLDPGGVRGYAHVEARSSRTLSPGGLDTRGGRFDLHRVSAPDAAAVSLHVYAAPLREYLVYDALQRRCETAFGRYDDVISPYAPARGR